MNCQSFTSLCTHHKGSVVLFPLVFGSQQDAKETSNSQLRASPNNPARRVASRPRLEDFLWQTRQEALEEALVVFHPSDSSITWVTWVVRVNAFGEEMVRSVGRNVQCVQSTVTTHLAVGLLSTFRDSTVLPKNARWTALTALPIAREQTSGDTHDSPSWTRYRAQSTVKQDQ